MREEDEETESDDEDLEIEDDDSTAGVGQKNYMTPPGYERLKKEYHELFHVERPKIVETVAWAASNGDRSENADYIYGKRRLREIDRRLRFLGKRMASAVIVEPTEQSSQVLFGAKVTVEDEEGRTFTYKIVGEDEINVEKREISWVSPVAKALLNCRVGDMATVKRPGGETELKIIKIEYEKTKT